MNTIKRNLVLWTILLGSSGLFLFRNYLSFKAVCLLRFSPLFVGTLIVDEIFGCHTKLDLINPITMNFRLKRAPTASDWVIDKIEDHNTVIYTSHFEAPAIICDHINSITDYCGVSNW